MVEVSDLFRDAVRSGNEQDILIRFEDGTVFTGEDISAEGVRFSEMINPANDLTIGACPSSTLTYTIINDDRLLGDFDFGTFSASLGVRISERSHTRIGNVSVVMDDGRVVSGYDSAPQLRVGQQNVTTGFPVKSIIVDNGRVFAFGDNGRVHTYPRTWGEVATYTWGQIRNFRWKDFTDAPTANAWMREKIDRWVSRGIGVVLSDDAVRIYEDPTVSEWEYVPLGQFIANRPKAVNTNLVRVDATDKMVLFDRTFDDLTLPVGITHLDALEIVCDRVGVKLASRDFLHSERKLTSTLSLQDVTCREFLGIVAEAACGYARFNRDGGLEIAWYSDTSFTTDESGYVATSLAEIPTPPISKLRVANSNAAVGTVLGDGENGYSILDNPLLYVDDVSSGVTLSTPIFNRLSSFPAYHPGTITLFADWSLQAGDIINVTVDGKNYVYPIFTLAMRWSGGNTLISVTNSGNAVRPPVSATNRRKFSEGRRSYSIETTINGLESRADRIEESVHQQGDEFSTVIETTRSQLSTQLQQTAEGFETRADSIEETVRQHSSDIEDLDGSIESTRKELTSELQQTASGIEAKITSLTTVTDDLEKSVTSVETSLSILDGEVEAKVDADNMVSTLNLNKEGVKIAGKLIDITGTVSLNGDTKVDSAGTLTTKNMVATAASITGVFSAPYTRLGQVVWDGEAHQGIFFSSTSAFSASKIVGAFARDSYGEYHLTATGGSLNISTELGEPVLMDGSEVYITAHASDETLVIGRDPNQASYADLCVYPESSTYSTPRGNCGTPAHPWDTCTADQFFSDNGIKSRSSRSLKRDIEALPDMGDVIDNLRPVSFRYKSDRKSRLHYGLIYEDTESVAPILCEKSGDRPEDCRIGYDAINLILLREMQAVRLRLATLERGGKF